LQTADAKEDDDKKFSHSANGFEGAKLQKKRRQRLPSFFFLPQKISKLFSAHAFVRNGEFFSPFRATSGQHSTAVGGGHSFSETMFVFASSVGRLECSFHLISAFVSLKFWGCKNTTFFETYNILQKKSFNNHFQMGKPHFFLPLPCPDIDFLTTFANALIFAIKFLSCSLLIIYKNDSKRVS
jgi:hypothetical protein